MGRGRKTQLIIIVILVVAVTGLSVGLAVFSNTLTISSGATVKPNSDEYKVTIYGVVVDLENVTDLKSEDELFSKYASTTISVPTVEGNFTMASPATIDNETFTISNISVAFAPNVATTLVSEGAQYLFAIRNDGAYDVYFDPVRLKELISTERLKTCTAVDPTKQELADLYCENAVEQVMYVGDFYVSETSGLIFYELREDDIDVNSSLKLAPRERVAFVIRIEGLISNYYAQETGGIYIDFEKILLEFGATDIYGE